MPSVRQFLYIFLLIFAPASYAIELDIKVSGLSSEQEKNVREFLTIEKERSRPELKPSRIRYLHSLASGQIKKALEPYGYFQPRIKSTLNASNNRFTASYDIDTGEPVTVTQVDFQVAGEGSSDPNLTHDFPVKSGERLIQSEYDDAKRKILTQALEAGYLNTQYTTHRLEVDINRNIASITLHLDTGPRFKFGEVRFEQDFLDESFLIRYITFNFADPFDQEKLLSLQSSLINSEYFDYVEVRPQREQAIDNQIPIDIILTPNKANRYRFGVGFATDVGPRLSADWQRRYIGRHGENLQTELSLSPVRSHFRSQYVIPLERPTSDALSYAFDAEDYDTDSRRGQLLALGVNHSIGLEHNWRRDLSLEYASEDFDIVNIPATAHHLMPAIRFSKLETDGRPFILRGYHINFQIKGAHESILSSSSFLQTEAHLKSIYGFKDDLRLIGRIDLGATLTSKVSNLPSSLRFFAGGDNSLRGFDLDELGPTDNTGNVTGGRFLATGSLELEQKLHKDWSVAAFMDLGNAYDPDQDNHLATGAGFGVRWQSPVGAVRFDLASAVSEPGRPWRIHVTIGPDL